MRGVQTKIFHQRSIPTSGADRHTGTRTDTIDPYAVLDLLIMQAPRESHDGTLG